MQQPIAIHSTPIQNERMPELFVQNEAGMRFERKFVVRDCDYHVIESIVRNHPVMFTEIHRERYINSIYMDTPCLSNYKDNVNGSSQRIKARVRWYGELHGEVKSPVLELKIKKALIGTKFKYNLVPFSFDKDYTNRLQQEIFYQSKLPEWLIEYLKELQPWIAIRYRRKYFESSDRKYRVTLDQDIEYYKVGPMNNCLIEKACDYQKIIIELKYSVQDDKNAQYVTNRLPFRLYKNSKYVTGIDYLYNYV